MIPARSFGALLLGLILTGVGCSSPRAEGQDQPLVEPPTGDQASLAQPTGGVSSTAGTPVAAVDREALRAELQQRVDTARESLAGMQAVQVDVLASATHVAKQARAGQAFALAEGLEEPARELDRLAVLAEELGVESGGLDEELQRVEALVDAYTRWLEFRLESGDVKPADLSDSSSQLNQASAPLARSDALADRAGALAVRLEEQRRVIQAALTDPPPKGTAFGDWLAGRAQAKTQTRVVDAAPAEPRARPVTEVSRTPAALLASDEVVELTTSHGALVLELFDQLAPQHVTKFRRLVREGFYDGQRFHRIIPGYWVQTGCPLGTGAGGDGKRLHAEFSDQPFERGTVAMARMAHPDSASTQFLIALNRLPDLDAKYTIFGRVIRGNKVLDAIAALGNDQGLPTAEVVLERARLRPRAADEPSRSLAEPK